MTIRDLGSFDQSVEKIDSGEQEVIPKECSVALSPSRLPGLDFALNPYAGCSHRCTYCYAPYVMRRPPSEWGKCVVAKTNIAKLLAKELPKKKGVIGLGTVTDPYQKAEAAWQLSRKCLVEIKKADARVSILTKSDLVARDIDLLKDIERCEVGITITTESDDLVQLFESNAPAPTARFKALEELNRSGIDTYVLMGPLIPEILGAGTEAMVQRIVSSGTRRVMLDRLNLRPGMEQAMYDALCIKDRRSAERFRSEASSDQHYEKAIAKLESACMSAGLKCARAF